MSDDDNRERITVLAREFPPAAMEFHRRRMSAQGFRMEGRITRQRFVLTDGVGDPQDLLEGETFYAVTFVRERQE